MVFRIFIAVLAVIVFQGCAKIGKPTGGPEDLYPPEYVSGTPANRSLNFNDDQIDIFFNEYLQLKDQNKEFLISPPMKKKPVLRVREKSIRITFEDTLISNTTYTLNFGKSLSDLNEGNGLPDFEFVFSTGNVIDSLSVTGKVVDAFSQNPEKEAPLLVMLYENLSDSAPLSEIPRYYGRSNENGLFAINNIHPDTYRIVAINDGNNDLIYNPGLESIAFLDSLLVINAGNVIQQTFIKDTIKIITPALVSGRGSRKDTTSVADTIIAPGKLLNALNISLYSFMEENMRVFVTTRERSVPEKLSFIFNRPLFDSLVLKPINFITDGPWYILESSANRDTMTYWIPDTIIASLDTLRLSLTYTTTDSSGLFISRSDTVRLRKPAAVARGERGGGRRLREEEAPADKPESLALTGNVSNRGTMNLNAPIRLTAPRPIQRMYPDSIELYRLDDTLLIKQPFFCYNDTLSVRSFSISSTWEEATEYKLLLRPGAVKDILGAENDSIEISFTTREESYYGTILLNFSSIRYPMIVQVVSEQGNVVNSKIANGPGILTYNFLSPGKYSFKAIFDENNNGKWDTGNYLKKLQPEMIYVSGKAEQLRSNWDWEPTWNITGE